MLNTFIHCIHNFYTMVSWRVLMSDLDTGQWNMIMYVNNYDILPVCQRRPYRLFLVRPLWKGSLTRGMAGESRNLCR